MPGTPVRRPNHPAYRPCPIYGGPENAGHNDPWRTR
jgi:hypothetical protein